VGLGTRLGAFLVVDLCCEGGRSLHVLNLIVDVLAVVAGHFHSRVEVLQSRLRHLESLLGDCRHTSEVGLIALVFKDGFFAQFDSVLFFELLDEGFKEFLLVFFLLDTGLNLERDSFLDAATIHSVTSYLTVKLHMAQRAHIETSLVEFMAETNAALLVALYLRPLLPAAVHLCDAASESPLVNPS